MTLSKQTITDKIETVAVNNGSYYVLQIREAIQVIEDGEILSQKYHRYVLLPNADTSAISDPVVLAQFNAIMIDEIKENYQTLLEAQNAELEAQNAELKAENAEINPE